MAIGCFVCDIEQHMPAGELQDWYRYGNTEPFGFHNDERRFSTLAANMLAASSNAFKDKRVYSPSYWMWRLKEKFDAADALNRVKSQFPAAMKRKRKRLE